MIKGTKYFNNKDYYYIQTNNPQETLLRLLGFEKYLLTCGPSTMLNCIAPLGVNVEISAPGLGKLQPEGVAANYFVSPENWPAFKKIRNLEFNKDLIPFYIPQYYPYVAEKLFNVKAKYFELKIFNLIASKVLEGNAIQACLKVPDHYIAVVAYDDERNELIYNDSRPERFADGNGFNRRMNITEFEKNVKNYFVEYYKI